MTVLKQLTQLRIKRIGNSVLPFLQEHDSLLDIGCGNGDLGQFIKTHQRISYHGVDLLNLSSSMPDKDFSFTVSDMPYPFEDKSFDAVMAILVLHHFTSPEAGLLEAIRLSKSRILLLEDVPRHSFERQLMKGVDYIGNRLVSSDIPLPFNFLNDNQWQQLFEKYNLKLLDKLTVYPLPFPRLNHFLYVLKV